MLVAEKTEAERIIKELPANASFEDIQYHIFVAEKLKKARNDISNDRTLSQKEVEKRLNKWNIK
jgi:hypothetical protein